MLQCGMVMDNLLVSVIWSHFSFLYSRIAKLFILHGFELIFANVLVCMETQETISTGIMTRSQIQSRHIFSISGDSFYKDSLDLLINVNTLT